MDTNGQTGHGVLLWSLLAMILPLVAFPARMGIDLARPSLVNLLYEMVFYGAVLYFFNRRASLIQLMGGAGVCLVYRLAVGLAFGVLIALMYSMQMKVSLQLGLSGYLPAILFHIAVAPFALKPIVSKLITAREDSRRPAPKAVESRSQDEPVMNSVAISAERGVITEASSVSSLSTKTETASEPIPALRQSPTLEPKSSDQERSGFERAVCYIGEHGSVQMAAAVDEEGLLLGSFARNQVDPETWAPLAMVFLDDSEQILRRTGNQTPERLDLCMKDLRVVVARTEGCYLMVLSERQDDDLLNIRINQGLEMINRFVAERYGDKLNSNAERIHVSSAQ